MNMKIAKISKVLMVLAAMLAFGCSTEPELPSYLEGYENIYAENPREAALKWFEDAKFGMFIHYSLYSLMALFFLAM